MTFFFTIMMSLVTGLAVGNSVSTQSAVTGDYLISAVASTPTTLTQSPTPSSDMCGKGQECDCDRIEDKNGDEYFRCVINWACEHCWITPWPPTDKPEPTTLVTVTTLTRNHTDSQGSTPTQNETPVISPTISTYASVSTPPGNATEPAVQTETSY
ncbi:hypothetical protein LIA77_06124 [Sarocladium implicatum]|nr:hypothetical protein LIA77_06124 [Sarocladium implicatum]